MLRLMPLVVGLVALALAACGDANSFAPATQEAIVRDSQTQQMPTSTPTPMLPGSITPAPASKNYRLDLGAGLVVAFVEGLSPEFSGKVAYVTHVPSGSQAVLDRDGRTIDRHDGSDNGPARLDGVLGDDAAMDRIMEVLLSDEDSRPRENLIEWIPSVRFGGISHTARWRVVGPNTITIEGELTKEHLGPELYRIAFRGDGYVGINYRYQDGDSTYLNPGTLIYAVKGYSPEFRLATLQDGETTLFEADTNPAAKIGEDLLDIRGKVTALDRLRACESFVGPVEIR